jgi:3-deoxy-D-manno-octulosonic-acid transferase
MIGVVLLICLCVSTLVDAQELNSRFQRADQRRVVYPGPLDQNVKPPPPKRTVKMVVGKLQDRISNLIRTIRHPGDEDDVEDHIDRLEKQFEKVLLLFVSP